jgi:uncharacterized membrane protein YfbV (UPF0208 family)
MATTATTHLDAKQIAEHAAVLASAQDRDLVATSALALASAGQAEAVVALCGFLADAAFLGRLDPQDEPQLRVTNLSHVLRALAANPTEATERVNLAVADSPSFQDDPDRMLFLLPLLAAVRPMSDRTAAIFRSANAQGHWSANGPLLVANASPLAMNLFTEMVTDTSVDAEERIAMIRWAVPAHRVTAGVLETAAKLLDRELEPDVDTALLETLFDYQGDEWFGVARFTPVPPPWSAADTSVLGSYLELGFHLAQTRSIAPPLGEAIERTLAEIREELARRWA